eukprot:PhM_4_TR1313/c1_g2_i1/m.2575/K00020/mmsB, HIBADH; 3-hydroxyisobutyrate dehydrogenase
MLRRTLPSNYRIAFIGLGQMGCRMVPNLLKNDTNTIRVYDTVGESVAETVAKAASDRLVAGTCIADTLKNAEVVITMLPNGKIVKEVFEEMLPLVAEGTTFIDCSTVDYNIPAQIAAEVAKTKGVFFDAPVSGGVNGAANGTLTFMVGGENFEKAKDVLAPMAANVFECGNVGAGQACKLSNNLVLAQAMLAVSEGMQLGTRLGIDKKVLAAILNKSTGQCWSSEKYNPCPDVLPNVPSSNGYKGGFASALMLKDARLAQDAARGVGLRTSGADNAVSMYKEIVDEGNGDKDFAFVYQHLQSKK